LKFDGARDSENVLLVTVQDELTVNSLDAFNWGWLVNGCDDFDWPWVFENDLRVGVWPLALVGSQN
jgi:hypothetical protein